MAHQKLILMKEKVTLVVILFIDAFPSLQAIRYIVFNCGPFSSKTSSACLNLIKFGAVKEDISNFLHMCIENNVTTCLKGLY